MSYEHDPATYWETDTHEFRFRVLQDETPESPREWDNLGTIAAWHRNYDLGDKGQNFGYDTDPQDYVDGLPEGSVVLSLYCYEHSGMVLRTTPFDCPWDSGQVGYIHATPERIKELGVDPKDVENQLRQEIETYSQFISGDVWGFVIESKPKATCKECDRGYGWEHVDSCWGFYGTDLDENGMLEHLSKEDAERVKQSA